MKGMGADTVDLIYLDPPFNSKRMYRAPLGSKAAGQAFKDIWSPKDVERKWHAELAASHPALYEMLSWVKQTHSVPMWSYLMYMAVRLVEMERILKPTGSIYLHCDPTASHYLKMVMDAVFGRQQFRNEVVWRKYAGRKNNAKHKFSTQHDCIFFYAKPGHEFQGVFVPHSDKEVSRKYKHIDEDGRRYRLAWGRAYQLTGKQKRLYLDESPGRAVGNLWVEDGLQLNTSTKERTGWQTQKPIALLERILEASSKKGDVVFDPFCGCATAMVAAEKSGRQWIGCDLDEEAQEQTRDRIADENPDAVVEFLDIRRPEEVPDDPFGGLTMEQYLFGQQLGICNLCRYPIRLWDCDNDHIKPKGVGGRDDVSNRQLLCGRCNSVKARGSMKVAVKRIQEHAVAGRLQLGSDFHAHHRRNGFL